MARLCLGTFLVITEPAPVYDPSDRVIGATIEVLDPTKTPSSILVLFLFWEWVRGALRPGGFGLPHHFSGRGFSAARRKWKKST